jgi:hypothetical protein
MMTSMDPNWLGTDEMWEIVCRFEDGGTYTPAERRALSEHDRAIFDEEIARIRKKELAAEEAARKAAPRKNLAINCAT